MDAETAQEITELKDRVKTLEALLIKDKGVTDDEQYLRRMAAEMRRDPEAWKAKMKGKRQ